MPPSIPTSFIPHPAGAPQQRYKSDFVGALALVAYVVLAIVVALALGLFFYGRILAAELSAKDAALSQAESGIDPATVEQFVRLRDRLTSSETLLNGHIAVSNFFTTLDALLPSTVRFTSLTITTDDQGNTTLQGAGSAATFNALAAASDAFSNDGRIKDAIFSNITVGKGGVVSFVLSATLDPKIVAFNPSSTVVAPTAASTGATVPAATTTSSTTTP